MPSRYDDLGFNNGTYIPQYAPLPLEQIQRSADTLAGRHYQNLASASKLEILANQMKSQALEGARPYFDTHINAIDEALKDMAKNGGENSTARINALATAFQGDEGINLAGQRAEEYRNILAEVQKLGDQAVYHKDKLEALRNAAITTQGPDGKQVLNPLYSNQFNLPVNPYLDPTLDYKRITDEIKPDKWLVGGLSEAGQIKFNDARMHLDDGTYDIPKFLQEIEAAGVTKEKIASLKDEMFKAFKNTKSYAQQKEYFDRSDYQQMEDLHNYAKLGIYNQTDRSFHQVPVTRNGDGSKKNPPMMNNVYDVADEVNKLEPIKAVKNFATAFAALSANGKYSKEELAKSAAENPEYNQFFNAAKEAYSSDAKVDSREGAELVVKYLDEFYQNEFSNSVNYKPEKKMGEEFNYFLRTAPQNLVYLDNDGNVIKATEDGEFTKAFNKLTGGRPDKFTYSSTANDYNTRPGKAGSTAAAAGLHAVNSEDEDGNPKTFYVANPADIETNPVGVNTNVLYNQMFMKPGVFVKSPGGLESRMLVKDQKAKVLDNPKAQEMVLNTPLMKNYITGIEKQRGAALTPEERSSIGKQVLQQQQPLVEAKMPDGSTIYGTPASIGEMAFTKYGIRLDYNNYINNK
jgi:hypothetical protein